MTEPAAWKTAGPENSNVARQRHGVTTLTNESLADPEPTRNPTPLTGSLGDLVTRAQGRPIYCTPSLAVRRALMNVIVGSLRRDFPAAEFVDTLALYRNSNDRRRRWTSEREGFGAAIIVTRADDLPEGIDPFAGIAGQHVISLRLGFEIEHFARRGRPVAWHAVVFPASYWLSRFAIEPFNRICSQSYAALVPADSAEIFRPVIGPSWFCVVPAQHGP